MILKALSWSNIFYWPLFYFDTEIWIMVWMLVTDDNHCDGKKNKWRQNISKNGTITWSWSWFTINNYSCMVTSWFISKVLKSVCSTFKIIIILFHLYSSACVRSATFIAVLAWNILFYLHHNRSAPVVVRQQRTLKNTEES